MAFLDFFKKEEPKKSDRETVSDVRSSTQQIAAKLTQIRYGGVTGGSRISQEKMDKYRASIGALASSIGNAQILRLDTKEIDERILHLAECLQDSISKGSEITVERILKGLRYGITEARREIDSKDANRTAEIIEKRVRMLDVYKNIVYLSQKIDKTEKSQEEQERLLERYRASYEANSESLKKAAASRPDLVRQLDELGFASNELSGAARALDTARMRVIQISERIENLERQKESNAAAMLQHQMTIDTLESQMTQTDAMVDEQVLADIIAEAERFRNEMQRLESQIDEMERMNKDFTRAMDAIYSSPEMVDRIIRHAMEYEELERKEAAKEAGIREGLENMAALEAQENESLLNG